MELNNTSLTAHLTLTNPSLTAQSERFDFQRISPTPYQKTTYNNALTRSAEKVSS